MTSATVKTRTFRLVTPRDAFDLGEILKAMNPTEKEPVRAVIGPDTETRSAKQNRLSHLWYPVMGAAYHLDRHEMKAYCKLAYGVPIMREDKDFNAFYTTALDPLDWDQQLDAMLYVPVTSLMKVKQMAEYLTIMDREAAVRGVVLPAPDDLYWAALMKEANRG
jgi:hypothetical protein